jgi:apolipoprotein N-acyltransferase
MNQNIRFSSLALSMATVAMCGYKMSQIPLFGWWTLPFLMGIWASIVLVFLHRYNLRWLALSTLSGILLTLGFPTSPIIVLIFIGFVPLLMVEREISTKKMNDAALNKKPTSTIEFLKYAFNTFVIWNIGVTWWVANAGLVAGMVANYLNAFFMAGVCCLFHRMASTVNQRSWTRNSPIYGGVRYFIFIIFWLSFEFLHLSWELSWPWLTLGNAFANSPMLIQWYEYTGFMGGSLWILVLNVLIFKAYSFYKYEQKKPTPRSLALVGLVFFIPTVFSFFKYQSLAETVKIEPSDRFADVIAVQPNYEPHYEKFDVPPSVQLQKFLQLTSKKIDYTIDYVIFPETSFDLNNIDFWEENETLKELKNYVHRYPKLNLVTGVDALKVYASRQPTQPKGLPKTARKFDNHDGTFTYWEAYNAATQISTGSIGMPFYKKSKLVPGPEILPYGFLFSWAEPIFKSFGGTVGGLGTQPEPSSFSSGDGSKTISPVICYESIYGDYCRGYVKAGAEALFVVTNDGWWDDTPGYQQHQAFARLRAIELRRSVVRAANTGTSCFINMRGDVEQATKYGEDAVIRSRVELNKEETFYAKYGEIIGYSALFLAGMAFLSHFFWLNVTLKIKSEK